MQTPTVGRFVHFQVLFPASGDESAPITAETKTVLKARSAVVTDVNADGTVELTVFPPKSASSALAAPLYQMSNVPEAEKEPTNGCWNWPPRS